MAEIKFARLRITSPAALRSAVESYFTMVEARKPMQVLVGRSNVIERRVPPTMAGLARALGVSTTTLAKYLRGEVEFPSEVSKKTQDELLRILTDARMRIEDEIVTRGLMGDLDNTVVRQHMSMFGYTRSMDESGEEANNTVRVIVQSASDADINNWSK